MTMCLVLNVARAGFYAWLHNPVSARDKDNQRLLKLIRDSYSLSGGVYGYRRVHGDLTEIGETCGKNRDLDRADIFDYIEVLYNRARRHSHLGGVNPEAFEQASSWGQSIYH